MDAVSVFLLIVLVVLLVGGGLWLQRSRQQHQARRLSDAKADAQRWYHRLGGQVMNLAPNDDEAVKQALVDAGERYNAAGSQLEQAETARQHELAGQSAIEGLCHVRAARLGLGMDAGPELPLTEAQRQNGVITSEREVTVEGEHLKASPRHGADTPYYYPGGQMQGRHVPAGYYSQPWWKSALASGAGVLGAMVLFDALFVPDMGYGGDMGGDAGADAGGDMGGGDFGGGMDMGGGFDF
ncbi:MAG: hypothetical protein ACRDTQ_07960 [Micromonosporaceae bacterium]